MDWTLFVIVFSAGAILVFALSTIEQSRQLSRLDRLHRKQLREQLSAMHRKGDACASVFDSDA